MLPVLDCQSLLVIIFDQVAECLAILELVNPQHSPHVGSFISPDIDTRLKGPTAFSVSFEGHRQSGVNKIDNVSKWQQVGEWSPGPLN